ncbi:MAG: TfoX/Sxy family protein [Hyphomicrobiaceae bacterium]|nr:TfoX/Sxy family protein [Hyphomicrobiaceae bacterium]
MARGPDAGTFAAFLAELMQPLGPVTARRMFSGAGLFCDGLMFGLIIGDVLYLKADEASRGRFEAEGAGPFVYTAKGRSVAVGYWRAPERLLDEPDELVDWSRTAFAVARRAAAGKAKPAPKPGSGRPGKAAAARPPAAARRPGAKRGAKAGPKPRAR